MSNDSPNKTGSQAVGDAGKTQLDRANEKWNKSVDQELQEMRQEGGIHSVYMHTTGGGQRVIRSPRGLS